MRQFLVGFLMAALAAVVLFGFAPAEAQMPRAVTLGATPPGTLLYGLGSGVAKVVSGGAPFQMVLQPHAGTSTHLPLVNSGELDFGVINSADMGLAYRGPTFKVGGRNPFPHSPNTRLAMRGSPLVSGLVVKRDSPIKSVHDVKGKRATGEYPAHLAVWYTMLAALTTGGLSWEDVKVVPVPAVNDGIDALVQGRAEVSMHALGSAKLKEADAAAGVRHISADCSPQGVERLRKAVPGHYALTVKAGTFHTIVEDTCVIATDVYVITHRGLPDAVVHAVLKTIWENIEQLPALHPVFKQWTRDRAVDQGVTMPYHPGAVRFYKERHAWKPEMDQVQQKLLALNP